MSENTRTIDPTRIDRDQIVQVSVGVIVDFTNAVTFALDPADPLEQVLALLGLVDATLKLDSVIAPQIIAAQNAVTVPSVEPIAL
jgi:hypothetical protein